MYEVTKEGVVLSNNKPLKPFKVGKDRKYLKVRLYQNGTFKDQAVHRLVAEKFLPNPDGLPHVHHKDENTFNNSVENLQWVTAQYNKEVSSSKEIRLKNPEGVVITFFNISKFCREYGLSNGCVYHLLSGRYAQHRGWTLP